MDMKIWLLPDPDSPTIPSTSPALSVKLTLSTASTEPDAVAKRVVRLLTVSSGSVMAQNPERSRGLPRRLMRTPRPAVTWQRRASQAKLR